MPHMLTDEERKKADLATDTLTRFADDAALFDNILKGGGFGPATPLQAAFSGMDEQTFRRVEQKMTYNEKTKKRIFEYMCGILKKHRPEEYAKYMAEKNGAK